ncbi:MAG: hypothetical protein ACRDNP_10895 [Gaiellaceae bacterium]
MLTTDQKGVIAETAIAHAATKLGIEVYRPIVEGGRFDMIFLLGRSSYGCSASGLHGSATGSWFARIPIGEHEKV